MTHFEIFIDYTHGGMDRRPHGASELLDHLADVASGKTNEVTMRPVPLHPRDAGDAHNYICALESRVVALSLQFKRLQDQTQFNNKMLEAYQKLTVDQIAMQPGAPIVLTAEQARAFVRPHDPDEPSSEIETRPGAL